MNVGRKGPWTGESIVGSLDREETPAGRGNCREMEGPKDVHHVEIQSRVSVPTAQSDPVRRLRCVPSDPSTDVSEGGPW